MAKPCSRLDDPVPPPPMGVRSLLHQPVLDRLGRTVGRIDDLMLDAGEGAVCYVVLSVADDQGDVRRFAVPWHVLRVLPRGAGVMADLSRDALVRSPGLQVAGCEAADEPPRWQASAEPLVTCGGGRVRW